ncbi:hypothetical protein BESB_020730 [Besnoitia besnoiti]|uniref:TOG domain-containing protein n=1 Tax=Besnoitia besnoiti TaxID=94643 RepID=A0A2A9M9S9_BESBE|nr:hypothetical protein BESB_020730 [Besnoitia besnoiti]PFH32132.1 hypothetical protein BESB_020730 [Besnoitia besnoiti]
MGLLRKSKKKTKQKSGFSSSSSSSPAGSEDGERELSVPRPGDSDAAPEKPPEPQESLPFEPLTLPRVAQQSGDPQLLQQLFIQQNMLQQQILTQQEELKRQWRHQRDAAGNRERGRSGRKKRQGGGKRQNGNGADTAGAEAEARRREEERKAREERLVAQIKELEAQIKEMQETQQKEKRELEEERRRAAGIASEPREERPKADVEEHDQVLTRLQFSVVHCSSFQPPYTPENLTPQASKTNGKGWQSAPHCAYPQEIGLALEGPSQIKFFQLLSHETKIARKIELWVANAPSPSSLRQASPSPPLVAASPPSSSPPAVSALAEGYHRAHFTRLGYLRLSSNVASRHRARELKSVNLPQFFDCLYVKLVLVAPHALPEVNSACQVSLIALNCLGVPAPSRAAPWLQSPRWNAEEARAMDQDLLMRKGLCGPSSSTPAHGRALSSGAGGPPCRLLSAYLREKESLLASAKTKFVAEENFAAAVLVRRALDKLAQAKPHIERLEKQEQQAAEREDFEEARRAKAQLLSWQLCVKKTVAAALCMPEDPLLAAEEREEKLLLKDSSLIEHLAQNLPASAHALPSCADSPLDEAVAPRCPCDPRRLLDDRSSPLRSPGRGNSRDRRRDCALAVSADSAEREAHAEREREGEDSRETPPPPVSLDDMPICPMRSDRQRLLMLLATTGREESPPPPGEASALETTLQPEDEADASLLFPFFSRDVVLALFAADIQTRCAAQETVVREIKDRPNMVTGELFFALCPLIRRAFADKTLKVFLGGSRLLSLFAEAPALHARHFLSAPVRGILHELLLRVGSVFSDRARKLLLLLCSCHPELKDVLAREVFDSLVASCGAFAATSDALNLSAAGGARRGAGADAAGDIEAADSEKRRAIEAKGRRGRGGRGAAIARADARQQQRPGAKAPQGSGHAIPMQQKSTVQLLQLLVSLLAAFCLVEPLAPGGLPLAPLLGLLRELFQSPSGDIRASAVQITALLILQLPHAWSQAKIKQFMDTLRPKQRDMIAAEVDRLEHSELPPPALPGAAHPPAASGASDKRSPTNAKTDARESPTTKKKRHKEPAEQASGKETPQSAAEQKSTAEGLEDEEATKGDVRPPLVACRCARPEPRSAPQGVCEFCLEHGPLLASQSGKDTHFLNQCPMLTSCPHCRSIVEVSFLSDHFLSECPKTSSYVRCSACQTILLKAQLAGHKQLGCRGQIAHTEAPRRRALLPALFVLFCVCSRGVAHGLKADSCRMLAHRE